MENPPEPARPHVERGFHDHERDLVARLFWQAFREKLSLAMGPDDKARAFIARVLDPDFALVARDAGENLLGVAGYKTRDGALIGGGLRDLAVTYGWIGAVWRAGLLAALERDVAPGVLLMDGIFVTARARGQGAGSALLTAVKATARAADLHSVRLDVIDSNPRARALYERHGFVARNVTHLGPLRHVFGFRSSTEMHCPIQG